jgi:hypothetical protein
MKKTLTLITMCIAINSLKAQNIQNTYQDAIKLAEIYRLYQSAGADIRMVDPSIGQYEYKQIISKYNSNYSDIKNNNPFFKGYLIGASSLAGFKQDLVDVMDSIYQVETKNLSESTGSFGTDWQSTVINGVADFMAGRFKAEVLHMGLEQLFNRMQVEDAKTIELLFPKTFKQINLMYDPKSPNSYYTADLLFLRQLVITDLESMPENILQSDAFLSNLTANQKDLILSGFNICKYSKQGYSIPRIIEKLSQQTFKDAKVHELFSYANLFSQALLDNSGGWVNPIQQLNYIDDTQDIEVRYFYGLLYEQLKNAPFVQPLMVDGPVAFSQAIQEITSFVNSLNEAYDLAKEKKFTIKDIDEYLDYADQITTGIEQLLKNDILKTQFGLNDKAIEVTQKYLHIIEPFVKKNYQRAVPLLIAEISSYLPQNGDLKYIRTASFLSQLATIKDEKDMELLLQSYALPIGSSSIKRNSNFNISVNGYVGLTGGLERAYSSNGNKDEWNFGLTAPIGISFTKWNTTLFVSVLDLGSMVNLRLNNDSTFYSGLKFENFLSPGAGLYYNIPKAPITLGLQYSYIPGLRNIKYENNEATVIETHTDVSRINFSVLVDIPFFTLYNKDKSKKK